MEILLTTKDKAVNLKLRWLTNRDIAKKLKISTGAVSNYTKHLTHEVDEIINLTPHAVVIDWITYESKWVLRAERKYVDIMWFKWIPAYKIVYNKTDVLELPKVKPSRIYIVSKLTAWAYPDRPDLYIVYIKGNEDKEYNCKVDWLTRNPFYISIK